MKRINKIRVNNFEGMIKMTEEGETLIKKIQRILDENEPLTDGAPMIYTPKQAGVSADELSRYTKSQEKPGEGIEKPKEREQVNVELKTDGNATTPNDN